MYPKWHYVDDSTPATSAAVDQLLTTYVLGVEIDEDVVREYDGRGLSYARPLGRRKDGSVGER